MQMYKQLFQFYGEGLLVPLGQREGEAARDRGGKVGSLRQEGGEG